MRRALWLSVLFVMAMLVFAACGAPAAAPAAEAPAEEAAAEPTEAPAEEAAPADASAAVTETGTATEETATGEEAAAGATAELPEVNPLEVTGDIVTAGSSTVYPLSEAMAERFINEGYAGNITIDSIGTGAGFERFCKSGETDISNASRAINDSELADCQAIGRTPIEFRVGTDALAIVVNPENDWLADGVTMEQLALIFSDDATNWSDVDPSWPAEPIERFAPGTDSGTYDYFIEVVMTPVFTDTAEAKFLGAANLQQSEDDNVLVQGVEGSKNGIGFFGFAYYLENEDRLTDLPINGVSPDEATVEAGEYPLARPLFIYSDAAIIADKPQVGSFINFYLTNVNDEIGGVGYFAASDDALNSARANLAATLGQ